MADQVIIVPGTEWSNTVTVLTAAGDPFDPTGYAFAANIEVDGVLIAATTAIVTSDPCVVSMTVSGTDTQRWTPARWGELRVTAVPVSGDAVLLLGIYDVRTESTVAA